VNYQQQDGYNHAANANYQNYNNSQYNNLANNVKAAVFNDD